MERYSIYGKASLTYKKALRVNYHKLHDFKHIQEWHSSVSKRCITWPHQCFYLFTTICRLLRLLYTNFPIVLTLTSTRCRFFSNPLHADWIGKNIKRRVRNHTEIKPNIQFEYHSQNEDRIKKSRTHYVRTR